MKYTFLIFLFFSINVHAQKALGVYRVIEKTSMSFDRHSDELKIDTVPIPMKSLNAKIMLSIDQLIIIDEDTTYINLGFASETKEDSTTVSIEWDDSDCNGDACSVYMKMYTVKEYDKVLIFYHEERVGYLYKLAYLKPDVIPAANSISVEDKKKTHQ